MAVRLKPAQSVLFVIDFQERFLAPIVENGPKPDFVKRALLLIKAAKLMEIPIIVSEQVPEKMGRTLVEISEAAGTTAFGKTAFGCLEDAAISQHFESLNRDQAIICGIETPICVTQTALALRERQIDCILAEDATSARDASMHELGLERMRAAGCLISHTESIIYEWMGSAEHPSFKSVLKLVKESHE